MVDELLVRLDVAGAEIADPVSRIEAHRYGIWHRSVAIVIVNTLGEVLLERRSPNKDLFPNALDIPGGHVQFGKTISQTSLEELREELGLDVDPVRLIQLCEPDEILERVLLPAEGILNLERKTAFFLQLEAEEEQDLLERAAGWARLSRDQLAALGIFGEVASVEFWSVEDIQRAISGKGELLASGTRSVFQSDRVLSQIRERCCQVRNAVRRRVFNQLSLVTGSELDDDSLTDLLLGPLPEPASDTDCAAVFLNGKETVHGAYRISRFRRRAIGDEKWNLKSQDPLGRYVDNLHSLVFRLSGVSSDRNTRATLESAKSFVSDLLNLPLKSGKRFRDTLGNLSEIAAARKAALIWFLSGDDCNRVRSALEQMRTACLTAGVNLLRDAKSKAAIESSRNVSALVAVNLGAAAAEFNNPDFQKRALGGNRLSSEIEAFCRERIPSDLSPSLGGSVFLEDLVVGVREGRIVNLVYLCGNLCQAPAALALCNELLRSSDRLRIHFVPKRSDEGNELDYDTARQLLSDRGSSLFPELLELSYTNRFVICDGGPNTHGLDPARMTSDLAKLLRDCSAIVAEGQAYAEIRGWRKPVYLSFRVNGRVAEAIHGAPKGGCGFVGLTPEVDHFEDLEPQASAGSSDSKHQARVIQTTTSYVAAVRSANFELIVSRIFNGDLTAACRQIVLEAQSTKRSFAAVVLGVVSAPPDSVVSAKYSAAEFPVFACGGGGGFNAVTLKALRMLGIPVVAGVPSTDDGGSSGEVQKALHDACGFVFGVGDMSAIIQDSLANRGKQAVLGYRFDRDLASLEEGVLERICEELLRPTFADLPLSDAEDMLFFVANQLNFARTIERKFRASHSIRLSIKGASIRNLNMIAAYEMCESLGSKREKADATSGLKAYLVLSESLGVPDSLLVLPVTYEEAVLSLEYEKPISEELMMKHGVNTSNVSEDRRILFGQRYIDKLPQPGGRVAARVTCELAIRENRPHATAEYIRRLRDAKLFIMGAGSLVGSQLAQLAVSGVVDVLLDKSDCRRILVLNHVRMDETLEMGILDQVRLIEATAAQATRRASDRPIKLGDLFSDVVVPRSVALEIEEAMASSQVVACPPSPSGTVSLLIGPDKQRKLPTNRYVEFLVCHPEVLERLAITRREVEVLSALEQSGKTAVGRSEAGRYRGPVFATKEDLAELTMHGIQSRNIHQVDSVGENWKLVKAEGSPSFEFFPGLVPEALLGIIRIALERGTEPVHFG